MLSTRKKCLPVFIKYTCLFARVSISQEDFIGKISRQVYKEDLPFKEDCIEKTSRQKQIRSISQKDDSIGKKQTNPMVFKM